jgi:hypothetical protein
MQEKEAVDVKQIHCFPFLVKEVVNCEKIVQNRI